MMYELEPLQSTNLYSKRHSLYDTYSVAAYLRIYRCFDIIKKNRLQIAV